MQTAEQLTPIIRERVRDLLAAGTVDSFIGYRAGSRPLRVSPHTVQEAEAADSLVWNASCINNLAGALHKAPAGRVGLLVKGCDGRTLVELLRLRQVRRDDVHIVGLPCDGMVDAELVGDYCPPPTIAALHAEGDTFVITQKSGETLTVPRDDVLASKCRACTTPVPPVYDELLGTPPAEPPAAPAPPPQVAELSSLSARERRAFWADLLSQCTLCYACQTACPLCFCPQCPVTLPREQARQQAGNLAAVFSFHLGRAYHMAGRCTGCMECERVCPQDVPLSAIFGKVEHDSRELFGALTGFDPTAAPALSSFAVSDPSITEEARTGDATTGDARTGDARTGEGTTGDATTGDATTGEERL
jgi:ferredoxin